MLNNPEWLKYLDRPDTRLLIRSEWGASQANHRTHIRESLLNEVRTISGIDDSLILQFLDLKRTPQISGLTLSISHTKNYGGYVWRPDSTPQIGFDLEDPTRVDEETAARAGDISELKQSPSAAHLWVAKEATFKSLLGPLQPQVFSQIRLRDWQPIDSKIHRFRGEYQLVKPGSLHGIVVVLENLIVGLCEFRP